LLPGTDDGAIFGAALGLPSTVVGALRYAVAVALVLGGCYYGDFRHGDAGGGDDLDDAASADANDGEDAAVDDATVVDAGAIDAPDDAIPIDAGPVQTLRVGLLASWPLDGNGTDASGNALDLSVTNLTYATGRFGQGIQMTANSTGTVKRPVDDASLRLATGDFTVSVWVNATDTAAANQFIVTKGFSANGWSVAVTSKYWLARHRQAPNVMSAFRAPVPNVFSHVMFERQGTALRLYVNGVVIGSNTSAMDIASPSTQALEIGSYESLTPTRLGGIIDDVAIWNRTLTATEHAYLAANPVP